MSDRSFGKYELGERLASGGMAEVFRGRVRGPEGFVKEVCIKKILPHFSEDAEFVEMFIAEARVAAQLHHANIVQIFDFDVVAGQYYIAMELVDGVDLRRLIHRSRAAGGRFPADLGVFIATEMLKGLHYAHTRRWEGRPLGLIHRDVSPHNVLVSHAGEVKLADFGIAKAASRASSTRTGVVKGKLPYMAPEQARAGSVDARVDVYATGVVLYEILAGARPFVADSDAEVLAAILSAPIPPISERRDDVPRAIEDIVGKLLARDPGDRFATASEALRALAPHAPSDGSIRLADQVAEWLGTGLGQPLREETVRLAPGRAQESEGAVVPAESDAPTRTRRPPGEPALPYAETAPGKSGPNVAPTDPTAIDGESSTRIVTSTGATPAPITRTGAIAAAEPAPTVASRPRARGAAWTVGLGLAASVLVALVWLGVEGGDDAILVTARPATAIVVSAPPAAALPIPAAPSTQPSTDAPQSSAPHAPVRRPEERGTGTLFVTAVPWAEVQIDGRPLPGQTPQTVEDVPTGRHRVVFTGPGGVRKTQSVVVRRGKRAVARESFEIPTE